MVAPSTMCVCVKRDMLAWKEINKASKKPEMYVSLFLFISECKGTNFCPNLQFVRSRLKLNMPKYLLLKILLVFLQQILMVPLRRIK